MGFFHSHDGRGAEELRGFLGIRADALTSGDEYPQEMLTCEVLFFGGFFEPLHGRTVVGG